VPGHHLSQISVFIQKTARDEQTVFSQVGDYTYYIGVLFFCRIHLFQLLKGDFIMWRLVLAFLLASASFCTYAGQNILTPMFGVSDWQNNSGHTAGGSSISFASGIRPTGGFRYLYMFDNNVAIGADIYHYTKNVNTAGLANEADVVHTHILGEYFFQPQQTISAFAGGGFGVTGLRFSGGSLDDKHTSGASIELNAGAVFKLSNLLSVQFEYKLTSFNADENINGSTTSIDTTASSLLMGVSFTF